MDIRSFFLGRREFKSAEQIAEAVRESLNFDPKIEETSRAESLLIFQTSKQQTWLVATKAMLYCVLDDLTEDFTKVQWSIPAQRLVSHGRLIIPISTHNKTERTGLVNIGEHQNWYFSRQLFTDESIEQRIRQLLSRMFLDGST
jgi:hypothetical protein